MTRRRLAAVVLLFLPIFARAQQLGAVDWVFLVDTSKSMRGIGAGSRDIFDDVKQSIATFVREASDGDSVAIFTFDRDARVYSPATEIRGPARGDLYAMVDRLQANGDRTHLGAAIQAGLERAATHHGDPQRTRAVVLFTDGKEDVRGIRDPVPIPSNLARVGDTFVFFVSMGEHEPQLDAFVRGAPRASVLRAPTIDAIRGVASEIRKRLPKPKPPDPPRITIAPATIDLGTLEPGNSIEHKITLTADKPTHVTLKVDVPDGVTGAAPGRLALVPGEPRTVTVQLAIAEDAQPGPKHVTIRARNARAAATLQVVEPSLFARVAKWLVAIALLAAAVFAAIAAHRKRNRLEGELEILQPRVASDAAFVGLPRLEANEIALSSIVPLDALAGSDARLFVRRSNGKKKVWIAAQNGALRINDVETPAGELFDADTIELGAAKLRFNRLGDERSNTTGEDL